jgi:hypothetical protein
MPHTEILLFCNKVDIPGLLKKKRKKRLKCRRVQHKVEPRTKGKVRLDLWISKECCSEGNPMHGFKVHFPSIQRKPVTHSALVVTEAASDFLHQSISCTRF